MTQLRQPPGSGVVVACTAKRELLMWQHNPGAAFRTFTARQTWYLFPPKRFPCFMPCLRRGVRRDPSDVLTWKHRRHDMPCCQMIAFRNGCRFCITRLSLLRLPVWRSCVGLSTACTILWLTSSRCHTAQLAACSEAAFALGYPTSQAVC